MSNPPPEVAEVPDFTVPDMSCKTGTYYGGSGAAGRKREGAVSICCRNITLFAMSNSRLVGKKEEGRVFFFRGPAIFTPPFFLTTAASIGKRTHFALFLPTRLIPPHVYGNN